MKIEINYQPSTEHYIWKLYTGADGDDEYYNLIENPTGETKWLWGDKINE